MRPMAPVFEQALEQVFSRWTLLNLAVDQGWGGRETRQKRQRLFEETIEYLDTAAKKRRPPKWDNKDDVQNFADWLYEKLVEYFYAEADDQSDEEVASICLRLHNTCMAGDFTFAEEVIKKIQPTAPTDLAQCKGLDGIEYLSEEDALAARMDGMDLDGDSNNEAEDDRMEDGESPSGFTTSSGYKAVSLCNDHGSGATIVTDQAEERPRKEPEPPVVDEDGFTTVQSGKRGKRRMA